jgi:hypothetical protein
MSTIHNYHHCHHLAKSPQVNSTSTQFHVIHIVINNESPEDSLPSTLFNQRAGWKYQFSLQSIVEKHQLANPPD